MVDNIKKHSGQLNASDDDETQGGSGTGSLFDADSGGSGSGGKGGKTGAIEFRYHDVLEGTPRDDMLAPDEIRRLLKVHKDLHKDRVNKQKLLREQRKDLKEGRLVTSIQVNFQRGFGMGGGGGGSSRFKKHPISNKAQFSGMDKQVIGIPSLNESETNAELKEALQNRLQNRYQNVPKFVPPRPRPG